MISFSVNENLKDETKTARTTSAGRKGQWWFACATACYVLISSRENLKPMHDLGPPLNDILPGREHKSPNSHVSGRTAYIFEKTPGMRASATVGGSGDSQRSGFHSSASSPHMAFEILHAWQLGNRSVPLGMGISWIILPLTPCMGCDSGITVSVVVLHRHGSIAEWRDGHTTYSRGIISTGGYLALSQYSSHCLRSKNRTHTRIVSRHTASRNGKSTSRS